MFFRNADIRLPEYMVSWPRMQYKKETYFKLDRTDVRIQLNIVRIFLQDRRTKP
jgi:hypothetical protein